jgi:hypothetical protein
MMLDVFYVGVVAAFFLISVWLVKGFQKLQPEESDE